MDNEITVTKNDMWILLVSTIRYSMGRKTSVVDDARELVLRYKDILDVRQLKQIAREIKRELEIMECVNKTLGDKCDHESWKRGWELIMDAVKERDHPCEPIARLLSVEEGMKNGRRKK